MTGLTRNYILIFVLTSKGQFHNLLLITFVVESNASWSGSEASEDFDANCEEVGTYRHLNGGEYKFVASVEEFEDAERGVLIHKCLAIIISSWNAISSAYCGERW